jgi:hypothetical protein
MEQSIRQGTLTEVVEPAVPGVSWAAVAAGAVASLALTLLLLSFGAGMGFAVVSPWSGSGVSTTSFEIGTGLYFIVMAMISSARRLSGRTPSNQVDWCAHHRGAFPGHRARLPGLGGGLSPWGHFARFTRKLAGRRHPFWRDTGRSQLSPIFVNGWLCRHVVAVRQSFRTKSAKSLRYTSGDGSSVLNKFPQRKRP